MTAPANKKRTHNAAARDAARRIPEGGTDRTGQRLRRSPYAERLRQARKGR